MKFPKSWILVRVLERSRLRFSNRGSRAPWLVLVTAVCVAASGLYAADNPKASSAPKPAAHSAAGSTHPATTPSAAKPAKTTTTASHAATHPGVTPHAGPAHYTARRNTAHRSYASGVKRTPNHSTAYASQHRGATARNRRMRRLSGPQRLARLHLQPQRVQEIQQALIREGYLQGDATGQWDVRTRDAMLRYQTAHGFPATGLPEAKSLMKLGLGSHPLPPELDHGEVGAASPGATPGDLTVTPPAPPVSQAVPPS